LTCTVQAHRISQSSSPSTPTTISCVVIPHTTDHCNADLCFAQDHGNQCRGTKIYEQCHDQHADLVCNPLYTRRTRVRERERERARTSTLARQSVLELAAQYSYNTRTMSITCDRHYLRSISEVIELIGVQVVQVPCSQAINISGGQYSSHYRFGRWQL
jgi:hypothetical protein